jgi:purine-nucleoside phosphorylase
MHARKATKSMPKDLAREDWLSIAYASVYGASMALEVVHVFGVLATRLVIQTGNFSALADEILAKDLFLATEAFCGEEASHYYFPVGKTITAPVFAAATYFGMDQASILYAFDTPRQRKQILLDDAEKDERRRRSNSELIEMALEKIRAYSSRSAR